MNKSEHIEMLASALSKFQGEIQNVFKGKKGYGYNYADLASILEDVRPILCKHGLSLVQLPGNSGENVSIETIIMHESGQYISEAIVMPVTVSKGMTQAQAIGSVISYARRYALTSALAIAQTDTDAREALEEERPKYVFSQAKNEKHIEKWSKDSGCDEFYINILNNLIQELKISEKEVIEWCKRASVDKIEDIPKDKMGLLVDMLQIRKEKIQAEEEARNQYD